MISMRRVLLRLLRILRFVRDYIVGHAAGCWRLFTAFLGRRINELRCSQNPKPAGTSQIPRTAESLLPGNRESSYSASGGSAVLREYVAASIDPGRLAAPSASGQPPAIVVTAPPSPTSTVSGTSISATHQPHPLYGINIARSSGNLSNSSAQSRASERLERIVNSQELLPIPVDRPPPSPKGIHRSFGSAVDLSTSRGQRSRSLSPSFRQNVTRSDSHLVITMTNVDSHPHDADEGRSPVVSPSPSSSMHGSLRSLTDRNMRSGSSTSINFPIQMPSNDSRQTALTEASVAMDPAHLTPSYSAMGQSETASQFSISAFPATSEYVLPDDRRVEMIHSDQIPRYYENITIPREKKELLLNPLTTTFPYFPNSNNPDQAPGRQNCDPWKAATHPDGALYFYDPKRRLFTDTNMYNADLREEMEMFYLHLEKIISDLRNEHLTIPSDYDLVLDIHLLEKGRVKLSYYFACHKARCLFWLDEYDASPDIYGVESPAQVKHHLEDLYWNHWSLYPAVFDGRRLPLHVYDELMGMLAHGCIDTLTSKFSTLPYDDEKMQKMITLVQNAKTAEAGLEHYTVVTTRLLCFFAHWRFLYFHGQRHARLLKNQSVYDKPRLSSESSRLIRFLSPLLFFAPDVHLREMKELWTDEIIIEITWKDFMTKLQDEWNYLVLYSTVMLAVNMGFHSLPGVMFPRTNDAFKSVHHEIMLPSSSRIASTLSLEASIGSILIGLFLVRHNRSKQELDPADAATYLHQSSQRIFGLEAMAIIFSLPWALLMWSMVTFSIALLLFGFIISDIWTRLFVALTSFPWLTFTLWCIWMCSDSNSDRGPVPGRLKFLFDVFESLRIRPTFPITVRPASEDGGSRHSPSSSRGDVGGV